MTLAPVLNFQNGNTPMHCASASGSHEVIVQLASNGVDVNARNTVCKDSCFK